VSSALSLGGDEARAGLRRKWSLVGTIFGFFLASYTGVLLSATALPFWSDARLMGALFLASGASTGMAAISLLLYLSGDAAGEGFKKIKRADRFAIVFEMAVLVLFLVLLGGAAAPLLSGHLAPLFWGGLVALGLVIPLLLDLLGGMRVPAAVPAVLVLVGGFVLRYVIVMSHA
jgi:formate-dependent nitrite reductase membrane component NrfD